ncbi:MAG: hypothetical protein WBM14_11445 [Terracidiphilus sp.]|jgi:hypothetical protein
MAFVHRVFRSSFFGAVRAWFTEPRQRLFVAVQSVCVLVACTFFGCFFFGRLPPPGVAVAILAVVAAAMSLHRGMRGSHKALWMLIIGAFLVIELLAIVHERNEQNEQQAQALKDERNRFSDIGQGIKTAIDESQKGFNATAKDSQKHFDAAMAKSDALYEAESKTTQLASHTLEQTEGGSGYCWLEPLPPPPSRAKGDPPWSIIVACKDTTKLPVVDVSVMIQEALSAHPTPEEAVEKAWQLLHYQLGTLSPGGWAPTQIELKPGKYNISIFSRKNAVFQQLSFGDWDYKTQTGRETSCVYQYQTGHLLTGSKECHNPR